MAQQLTIALAGNPNAGKTTLFNTLTGSRQHVGNYPGVTVEKKEGIHLCDGRPLTIVDLPGTYSLTAYSVEEVVARDFLVTARPQVIVNIVDAANIERNLYLTCQFLEMGVPMVIALNMIDVAKDRGIDIDAGRLAQLLGVEVVPIIARSGLGTAELMRAAIRVADTHQEWQPRTLSYGDDLDSALLHMEARIKAAGFLTDTYPARWLAIKYLENDEQIMGLGHRTDTSCAADLTDMAATVTNHLQATVASYPEAMIADHRYGFIKSLLKQGVMSRTYDTDRLYTSDRIDRVLTNRFLGPLCMMAVLLGLYHFTFTYSQLPVSWLGNFFAWLASTATHLLPAGPLRSLLVSGIINGVGGVLGFVPLIMFMFMGIAFLEDSGYLARVAFMMDRIFRIFGLHGSSVMPYIVSGGIAGGCAVPGVMATRTLRSPKERMATLLTVPFMNCGAKLPVLALLTAIFFAEYQAHMLLLLTLIAWAVALMAAKFLRLTVLRGESTPFVMELPPYRLPTFKGLLIHTWEKTWQYIRKAGTVILAISILLWAMMTFPGLPDSGRQRFDAWRGAIMADVAPAVAAEYRAAAGAHLTPEVRRLAAQLTAIDNLEAEETLRNSVAGRLGTALEGVSRLAGFDWRINIALAGGFAAKEIIISTLGTAYSLGEETPEATGSLSKTLAADPHWTPVTALALIVFIMFYSPCFATVVCIAREASWRWAAFSVLFNTTLAFLLATLVYQLGSLLHGG